MEYVFFIFCNDFLLPKTCRFRILKKIRACFPGVEFSWVFCCNISKNFRSQRNGVVSENWKKKFVSNMKYIFLKENITFLSNFRRWTVCVIQSVIICEFSELLECFFHAFFRGSKSLPRMHDETTVKSRKK